MRIKSAYYLTEYEFDSLQEKEKFLKDLKNTEYIEKSSSVSCGDNGIKYTLEIACPMKILQEKDIIVKPPHTYGWRATMIETSTAKELNAENMAYGVDKCKN